MVSCTGSKVPNASAAATPTATPTGNTSNTTADNACASTAATPLGNTARCQCLHYSNVHRISDPSASRLVSGAAVALAAAAVALAV